jgi:hypothetical protein
MKKSLTIMTIFLSIFLIKNGKAQTMYTDYNFVGTIGPTSVKLTFQEPDHFYNHYQGYYFNDAKQKYEFKGEDGVFDGKITLTESIDGQNVGYLVFEDLDYSKPKIVGKWFNSDFSMTYDIVLSKK